MNFTSMYGNHHQVALEIFVKLVSQNNWEAYLRPLQHLRYSSLRQIVSVALCDVDIARVLDSPLNAAVSLVHP